jgi:hypothetical protein
MKSSKRRLATVERRLQRAQKLVRQYIKPGASLAEDLIAERRVEFESEDSRAHPKVSPRSK